MGLLKYTAAIRIIIGYCHVSFLYVRQIGYVRVVWFVSLYSVALRGTIGCSMSDKPTMQKMNRQP